MSTQQEDDTDQIQYLDQWSAKQRKDRRKRRIRAEKLLRFLKRIASKLFKPAPKE